MKHFKRILCVMLAAMLLAGSLSVSAAADEKSTPKEEVVYVNLNSDGSVSDITVVSSFDLDKAGRIVDYGSYEELRNMTTTNDINYSGDKITVDAAAGKLYYEGKLSDNSIPWKISIRYYLDGEEISEDALAGEKGHLKIKINISENSSCSGNFFDGYALQATMTLDTKKCENISAPNATIANVGSDKQLSYIILPGKGTDITVEADVTDFEMDGIAINGVKLNLSISLDEDELQEKIDEITDAVAELDSGAGSVRDGASEIYEATGTLKDSAGALSSGAGRLATGALDLSGGLSDIDEKSEALVSGAYAAFAGLCDASGAAINAELRANGLESITLTPENYTQVLNGLLKQMDADEVYALAYAEAKAQVTAAVEAQADELYAGYIRKNSDVIIDAYIKSQEDTLCTGAARQIAAQQLTAAGMTEEQIALYLQTAEGQTVVEQIKAAMTEEQKSQILAAAKASLTDEQKQQILAAALNSLTDEQKNEIKSAYIEQQMASDEVTAQITATVEKVSTSAGKIAALKGSLDQYAVFYAGVKDYTAAVGEAAKGAGELAENLETMFESTEALDAGVSELNDAMKELFDGTEELKDGTNQFKEKTDSLSDDLDEEIDSVIDEALGGNVETGSFVSDKNTDVKSVQFVMKTDGISKDEQEEATPEAEETMNFWQKLLKLFGID